MKTDQIGHALHVWRTTGEDSRSVQHDDLHEAEFTYPCPPLRWKLSLRQKVPEMLSHRLSRRTQTTGRPV